MPLWFTAKPIQHKFNESAKFDFSKLGFLIQEDENLLPNLAYSEQLYLNLVDGVKNHRECMQKIQMRMEESGLRVGSSGTVEDIEAKIGPTLVATGNALTELLIESVEHDDADVFESAERLYNAMLKYAWRWETVTKIVPADEMPAGVETSTPKGE